MSALQFAEKEKVFLLVSQMARNLFPPNIEIPTPIRLNPRPESKFKRVWNKEQTIELYKACQGYSEATGKPLNELKPKDFQHISVLLPQTASQCIAKFAEITKTGTIKSGTWTEEEDELLQVLISEGTLRWGKIAKTINSKVYNGAKVRDGKKCKERWMNHLNPSISKGKWTPQEDLKLLEAFQTYGNKWKKISEVLEHRTDSYVKNRFKSLVRKEKQQFKAECPSDANIINDLISGYRRKLGLDLTQEIKF